MLLIPFFYSPCIFRKKNVNGEIYQVRITFFFRVRSESGFFSKVGFGNVFIFWRSDSDSVFSYPDPVFFEGRIRIFLEGCLEKYPLEFNKILIWPIFHNWHLFLFTKVFSISNKSRIFFEDLNKITKIVKISIILVAMKVEKKIQNRPKCR